MAVRAKVVPSLGFMGWISDPVKKLDMLFSYILESDNSQSTVFYGRVVSLQFIFAKYQNYPTELANELQIKLQELFGRYFEIASVQCKVGATDENNRTEIDLSISVQENGNTYEMVNTLALENGKAKKVVKEVNG